MLPSWREKERDLWWKILRSRDKWHLTSLLLADMLKQTSPEEFHIEIEKILELSKDDIGHMLLNYRKSLKETKNAKG